MSTECKLTGPSQKDGVICHRGRASHRPFTLDKSIGSLAPNSRSILTNRRNPVIENMVAQLDV